MENISFEDLLAEEIKDNEFWEEEAKLDFAIELNRILKRKKISKAQLAEKVGTSKAYMTKVFSGKTNFTLKSMVKIVRAIDAKIYLQIVEEDARVKSLNFFDGGKSKKSNREAAIGWATTTKKHLHRGFVEKRESHGHRALRCEG